MVHNTAIGLQLTKIAILYRKREIHQKQKQKAQELNEKLGWKTTLWIKGIFIWFIRRSTHQISHKQDR